MLRPRDSHDLRLIKTNLTFSPPASVRWFYDVFGNSVAIASFAEPSAELRIESSIVLETYAAERPPFQISRDALSYPFVYFDLRKPIDLTEAPARGWGAALALSPDESDSVDRPNIKTRLCPHRLLCRRA
jgi:Bacterial transglutaminase-like N-terminal region